MWELAKETWGTSQKIKTRAGNVGTSNIKHGEQENKNKGR